ncbi:phosphatase PAP2 family protein [Psychroserpens sp. Hel_I_66]|uniref:phosphatase PAP2 family protein n=1 Tax=Psychroserpens sp. Hel_I_66 TaxID=1250004 RepID=UPI00064811B0|nr:phosphatase PAP2 family protein [Psychroserpens sp. Hel_I_66]
MIEQLIEYDQELFIYLNGMGNVFWDAFWLTYTAKLHWIPFYALLGYLMYKKLDSKMFVLTLVTIALMITFTDQVTNLFKDGFMRLRPCYEDGVAEVMRLVRKTCGGRYGYFSGHASNSMGLAFFVGLMLRSKYKYMLPILIVWAALMGYSRIYVGAHYPLDVLSGMLFGGVSGFMFYKLDKYIQSRFQTKKL